MLFIRVLLHPCEDCLKSHKTHFWCTTTSECLPLENISSCQNAESHDLVLNATQCCSHIMNESTCLGRDALHFCLWCPDHEVAGELVPGKCLYKSDLANIRKNCATSPDITSMCAQHGSCQSCSEDIPCTWCATKQKCVSNFFDSDYYFDDGFACELNQMRFEPRTKQCICTGNSYFDQNKCVQCPANTTVDASFESCTCRQLAVYNKTTRECVCVDNSYNKNGLCVQCPMNAYAVKQGCVCVDANAEYDDVYGACTCKAGFNKHNEECVKCCKGSEWDGSVCTCAKGEWDPVENKCTIEDLQINHTRIGLIAVGVAAIFAVVYKIIKKTK
ncbi:Cysteine-rich_membrane protein 2 [Hexamita inflata]|uniref:Cysteine-rich membrane protein 2 n=1 Tax=Hexamita inflata TaxID=28002 RepID=A0AA86NYU6_9EUKA|nr:Cysteine-rich membrane protein 2 [Hexamita inflata]